MKILTQSFSSTQEELLLVNNLFIVVRTVGIVVIAIVLGILWHSGLLWYNPEPIFFILMPVLLLSSIVWYQLGQNSSEPEKILLWQLVVDALIIAAGVYFSGAGHSALHILVLIPVFSAALVSKRAVICVFLVSSLAMLAMAYGEFSGLLLPPGMFAEKEGLFIGWNNFFRPAWVIAVAGLVSFQGFYFISRMKEQNKKIAQLKDEFFFRSVHDLRSPLTALKWLTEKYQKKPRAFNASQFKKDINIISSLEAGMLNLIKDALAVSRGEMGKQFEAKQSFNASLLIKNLILPYTQQLKEKNISLEYKNQHNNVPVVINQELFKEVFINLLDNSIKYNIPGGKIEISLKQNQKNQIELLVKDTGIGISEEGLNKLFTPYFRDQNVSGLPGTGLGLYLVKKLVEQVQGSIYVNSKAGQGTAFTIII